VYTVVAAVKLGDRAPAEKLTDVSATDVSCAITLTEYVTVVPPDVTEIASVFVDVDADGTSAPDDTPDESDTDAPAFQV
jgi:hypothetical protein